jgi:hypothetical protein
VTTVGRAGSPCCIAPASTPRTSTHTSPHFHAHLLVQPAAAAAAVLHRRERRREARAAAHAAHGVHAVHTVHTPGEEPGEAERCGGGRCRAV